MPNTDPLLGPLQDNGGRTRTHALLPDSPAIDMGNEAQCPRTDQRGVPRPQDGDEDGWAFCDIGAYEVEGITVAPDVLTITGPGECFVDQSYIYTATVEPISTSLPLEYIWQLDGQVPITQTGGLTDTISFTWDMPGTQVITITTRNPAGSRADTHVITITAPLYETYLPLVIKYSAPPLDSIPTFSLPGGGLFMGLIIIGKVEDEMVVIEGVDHQ